MLRANKKVGFEGPLGLFEKLPDIFHYYYGYLDYRGAVVEADRCGKIKSETFDKLERYGVLESENLRMEGQLEKNEVDLEGFDKQLYE